MKLLDKWVVIRLRHAVILLKRCFNRMKTHDHMWMTYSWKMCPIKEERTQSLSVYASFSRANWRLSGALLERVRENVSYSSLLCCSSSMRTPHSIYCNKDFCWKNFQRRASASDETIFKPSEVDDILFVWSVFLHTGLFQNPRRNFTAVNYRISSSKPFFYVFIPIVLRQFISGLFTINIRPLMGFYYRLWPLFRRFSTTKHGRNKVSMKTARAWSYTMIYIHTLSCNGT